MRVCTTASLIKTQDTLPLGFDRNLVQFTLFFFSKNNTAKDAFYWLTKKKIVFEKLFHGLICQPEAVNNQRHYVCTDIG